MGINSSSWVKCWTVLSDADCKGQVRKFGWFMLIHNIMVAKYAYIWLQLRKDVYSKTPGYSSTVLAYQPFYRLLLPSIWYRWKFLKPIESLFHFLDQCWFIFWYACKINLGKVDPDSIAQLSCWQLYEFSLHSVGSYDTRLYSLVFTSYIHAKNLFKSNFNSSLSKLLLYC